MSKITIKVISDDAMLHRDEEGNLVVTLTNVEESALLEAIAAYKAAEAEK